jgi:hypothetical protein
MNLYNDTLIVAISLYICKKNGLERIPLFKVENFFFSKSKIFYAKDVFLGPAEIDWEQNRNKKITLKIM